MKKLTFVAFILGAIVLTIASCKKISNPEAIKTIDETQTATVSGVAQVQLIDTFLNNGTNPFESVPSGTKFIATIDSDDFPGVGNNGQDLNYEATVGADGSFSVSVPVPNDGLTVTIRPQRFRADYVDGPANSDVEENAIFAYNSGSFSVFLVPGANMIRDVTYDVQ